MGSTQKQDVQEKVDRTIEDKPTGLEPYQEQFGAQFRGLQDIFKKRLATPFSLEHQKPFSEQPEAIVQNLMSQGVQNIKAQEASGMRGLASRLGQAGGGGSTANLLSTLGLQSQIGSRGAMNALIPAALKEQRAQDVSKSQILAQQNLQRLQERAQSFQELAPGIGLLDELIKMGQISKGRKITEKGTTRKKARGKKSWF